MHGHTLPFCKQSAEKQHININRFYGHKSMKKHGQILSLNRHRDKPVAAECMLSTMARNGSFRQVFLNQGFCKIEVRHIILENQFHDFLKIIWYRMITPYRVKHYTSCFRKKKSKEKIFSFQKYA